MISIRKLAALDIAFLGRGLILAEFGVGVIGPAVLGVLTLLRAHTPMWSVFGVYLLSLGLNYVPLLLHAIDLCRSGTARAEIADEIGNRGETFRRYRRQSLLLLLPFVVPIAALYQHHARRRGQ